MGHIHEKYDFTVSFFVMHPSEKKIAMHYHKKLKLWNNFGGHIELDEDPLECIHKEMREETGLQPEDYDIMETYDAPRNVGVKELPNPFGLFMWKYTDINHWHIDFPYILKSKKYELRPQAGESTDIKWLTLAEITDYYENKKIDLGVFNICKWIFDKHM
jgi:8-oxo-dGTP pyrophosphatase MutT (NUDIX family)